MVERPGIGQIESGPVHLRLGGLGQHQHRFDLFHRIDGRFPEVQRHAMGHVAPIAVDVEHSHPVLHHIDHRLTKLGIVVVELDDIGPVGRVAIEYRIGKAVDRPRRVPVGMLCHPGVIPGRMVGHQIDDDVHAASVYRIDQRAEVLLGAVVRVDCVVVTHGIGRTQRSDVRFGSLFPHGMNGHEPERVDPQRLQRIQPPDHALKGPFRRKVGHKDLVEHRLGDPFGLAHAGRHLGQVLLGRRLTAECDKQTQQQIKQRTHRSARLMKGLTFLQSITHPGHNRYPASLHPRNSTHLPAGNPV